MSSQKPKIQSAKRAKRPNVDLLEEHSPIEGSVVAVTIPLKKIISTDSQSRRYFDPHTMQSLIESVRCNGILQPLLVRPIEGDKFELVFGERRYRAALAVGLAEVPAIVWQMFDEQAYQYSLVENLQREDLSRVEETDAILQLLAMRLGSDIAGVTSLLYRLENEVKGRVTQNVLGSAEAEIVEQVFASLGRMNWQSFVHTRLPLLKLPEPILEALGTRQIEYTKAKEIAKLESELEQQDLLEEAIAQSLTLSQIRERLKADQPLTEREELQNRLLSTYKKVRKSKLWDNPHKRQVLESLLTQMEALIAEEDRV
ncbi:MAG: ParB/RepB/Spo0J family partition protein [Chroococcidiopsidaceae cyanobacterium CP_BM_ER_R8_30]|nr:ParB/RepB/Spo0J family partition protein [Chroococcidiopsidaceae cyanobacterium CP_BM_ER_R8_30]